MSNAKIAITTTLKALDTWLDYIKSSGYTVRKIIEGGGDTETYYSDDAPGYGKLTPLASVFRDLNNRPSTWIFVRLPLTEDRADLEEVAQLKKEVARLKSKYEERCWCSVNIPSRCGHKGML